MAEQQNKQPRYGGYDYEFVSEVADRYYCQICSKVIREPHLAVCCGHHFCESCLNRWFVTRHARRRPKESCPHCRAKGEEFLHVINKGLRNEINQLKIKCSNHAEGCQWTGELEALKAHLKSDKGCGFVIIRCPNRCIRTCLRKDLDKHLSECSLRPYQCEHCGLIDTYQGITGIIQRGGLIMKGLGHYNECLAYPLT